eukprot:COSAG01_NODE_1134_length_11558_cov_8.381360_15_plen_213_part_00
MFQRSNPFARAEFRSRIKRFAIFTPFRLEERDAVAELALTEMAAHYQAAPRTRFTVGWEPSAVGYFSAFYGGTEGKTGLRPLVAAVTQISPTFPSCDHHNQNRRRNEQKCMVISVTASGLIVKCCGRFGCRWRSATRSCGRRRPPAAAACCSRRRCGAAAVSLLAAVLAEIDRLCNIIEAPCLVNGGHGASITRPCWLRLTDVTFCVLVKKY